MILRIPPLPLSLLSLTRSVWAPGLLPAGEQAQVRGFFSQGEDPRLSQSSLGQQITGIIALACSHVVSQWFQR